MVFTKADSPKLTTKGTPIMFHKVGFTYHTEDSKGKYMAEEITPNMVEKYAVKKGGNVSLDLGWKVRGNSSWMDLKTGCSIENIDSTGEANALSEFLFKLGFFNDDSASEVVEASEDDFPKEASQDDFEMDIPENEGIQSYSIDEILNFLNEQIGTKFYGDVTRKNKYKWVVEVSSLIQV